MVVQTTVDYLKDEKVELTKKRMFLENLNLSYSDLFKLKEIFNYDDRICLLIYGLTCYSDNSLENKIDKQQRKRQKSIKSKKMRNIRREKSYD